METGHARENETSVVGERWGVRAGRKHRPFDPLPLSDRAWPSRTLCRAPRWCSVDLRDGNQALRKPMGPERKLRLFQELVRVGFREIEVAFPGASRLEWDFVRRLVEEDRIPEHVTIQVLTAARAPLIDRALQAIQGVPRARVHLYNPTSELQRRVVFGSDRAGIVELAVRATAHIRAGAERLYDTDVRLEYSP